MSAGNVAGVAVQKRQKGTHHILQMLINLTTVGVVVKCLKYVVISIDLKVKSLYN